MNMGAETLYFHVRIHFLFTGFTNSSKPKYPTSNNYIDSNVEAEELTSSNLAIYKALVAARTAPSIMYGKTEYKELNNGTVFAFTR